MRKVLILLLVCLTVASTVLTAYAATSVSVSVSASSKTAKAGDKVTITVSATVDSCGKGGVELSFDKTVFELVSGEWLLSGTFMKDFDDKALDGVFAFESDKKVSGKVFKFVLKVKADAALGKETVTVKFTADAKSASKSATITVSCDHKYTNGCDTTCNACGATRTVNHSWDGGKVVKEATCQIAGSAKYTCKVCGETKTETVKKTAHSYDNNCDTSCNVCNASRKIEHSYQWKCDKQNHWKECVSCGDQQEAQAHSLETALSADKTGHGYACKDCKMIPNAEAHVFESSCDADCSACAYTRTVLHVYSERYSYDAQGHWHECLLCGDVLEKYPHTPSEAATEENDQICTTCGYLLEAAGNHVHVMAGDWLSDDFGHWFQCRCGEMLPAMEHLWDAGAANEETGIITYRCTDCGHMKAELFVSETEPTDDVYIPQENADELMVAGYPLWQVLAAGLGISLLLNIILIVRICVLVSRIKRNDIY